jgi:hypothetical protein
MEFMILLLAVLRSGDLRRSSYRRGSFVIETDSPKKKSRNRLGALATFDRFR